MSTTTASIGKKIGQAVRKLREGRKLSQNELREKAGLSTGYLSKLENGEFESPTMRQIFALAKALGVSLRDLLEVAKLIEPESSLEGTYRAKGLTEDQITQIKQQAEFFEYKNKQDGFFPS